MDTTIWVLLAVIAVIVVLIVLNRKEHYGGPVKNIRKIPFNNCQQICNTYYTSCMRDYGSIDAEWCRERFQTNCLSECYYSKYQRL